MVVDVWGRELLPHVPLLLSGSDSQLLCFVHPLKEDLGLEASNIQGQSAVYKPQLLRCVRAISCRLFLAPSEDVTWETTRLWSPGASPCSAGLLLGSHIPPHGSRVLQTPETPSARQAVLRRAYLPLLPSLLHLKHLAGGTQEAAK